VIPTRADERPNRSFDRVAYGRRNVVERCVGWLKGLRRIGTRFEKLAVNSLAMVQLAMIRVMLSFQDPLWSRPKPLPATIVPVPVPDHQSTNIEGGDQ